MASDCLELKRTNWMSEAVEGCYGGISFLHAKKATLINFTGSSYHWGCFGTSMEIYHTLLEHGYYVETVDVSSTHKLSPTVEKVGDFDDFEFYQKFCTSNPTLITALHHSDLIVVNGEGTLHRLSKGAVNLLYIMFICKKFLNRKVVLINFSCFPNGDDSKPKGVTQVYQNVIKYLDYVTPREKMTHAILSACDIEVKQSFDCLPRFLNRHNFINNHNPKGYILVSGGVNFGENRYKLLIDYVRYFLEQNISVKFLSGAKFSPAQEDIKLQESLRHEFKLSNIEIIQAQTMLEWCEAFQNASFLFSARFHHTIAALSIGTPFAYLNSNTPKIDAILETLNEDPLKYRVNEDDHVRLKDVTLRTIKNNVSNKSHSRVKMMLDLGSKNFITL